jgi:hypothetical protein
MKVIKSFILYFTKRWLPILIGAGILLFVLDRMDLSFSPSKWLKAQPVRIDETPLIISEMKQIAELQTAKLFCEVVTDSVVISTSEAAYEALRDAIFFPPMLPAFSMPKKIVLVTKGQVIAGIDLSILTDEDLILKGDTATLYLPPAQILDIISNPSDTEVFLENGQWTSAEIILVKQKAIRQMQIEAGDRKLIARANEKAIALMTGFLQGAGYPVAIVKIKE